MTGLDTNVLVRYLTQDEPGQSATANRIIEGAAQSDELLLIQPVVLCETVWVLRRAYRVPTAEVLEVIDRILRTAQFEVIEKDIVAQALRDARAGAGDFADYYIGRANRAAGGDTTLTFGTTLGGSPSFQVLPV